MALFLRSINSSRANRITRQRLLLLASAVGALLAPCFGVPQSAFAADAKAVAVGDEAPDFTAVDEKGRAVKLSSYRGKKNVVLVFSRAHW